MQRRSTHAPVGKRPRGRGSALRLVGAVGLLAVALAIGYWRSEPAETFAGRANAIDGDSLDVSGHEVRLLGIDAPEGRQSCTRDGRSWGCGEEARRALQRMIGHAVVSCRSHERDQYGRIVATCEAGGRNLGQAMVQSGLAVSYGRYRSEEAEARAARRGLWAGEFLAPREWRRQNGLH